MDKFYYLTQYDDCGMFDEDVIKYLKNNTAEVNNESLNNLLNLLPNVVDKYNEILYNFIMQGKLNDDNITDILQVWEALADEDICEAFDLLNIDICEILDDDNTIFDSETLEEIADEDLKTNGIAANALYWYNEIHSGELHQFNGYANGFYYYSDWSEVIENNWNDYFKETFTEAIDEI